ncbi:FecR family protein [Bradyrhizobium sp. SZCCHNRI3043]|uniref:FecR family protein n=1 Tax=Bradyrhizobium sp. SZCCHNRI3043 TaxID=3057292 RepID=UPI0028E273F3|nr:FecR family protein [Bradyrhizobium sp. SZCCHNRI3043]
MSFKRFLIPALVAACLFGATPAAFAADGEPWLVSKSSGEVWVTTQGAAQVSLGREDPLKPGDTIRTGPTGRVRLTRGAETIVIAPNSEVGLPAAPKDGMATTILQRAGSILLDVEKRNVQHFEVETPYLAAVVKGTQFSVTISGRSTKVEVSRGQVQVSDFKTGQIAQVMPGQAATAFATGRSGLSLSGAGTFSPIEHGRPRASTIDRVPVPRDGLHPPREAKGSVIHALNANGSGATVVAQQHSATGLGGTKPGVVRISSSIGEVNLNIQKATRGLAHGAHTPSAGAGRSTAWNDARGNGGNATSNSATASGTSGDSSIAAAVTAAIGSPSGSASANAASNGNGGNGNNNGGSGNGNNGHGNNGHSNNGNGNGGNGNSGNGNSGNGNGGNGNGGNGNSGSGNGNSGDHGNGSHGNGNAHAYGHNKN